MNAMTGCVLYTRDEDLARRVSAFLEPVASVRRVASADRLEVFLDRSEDVVLFLDLFVSDSMDVLPRVLRDRPGTLVIALGAPGSDPVAAAEEIGVYEACDRRVDRRALRAIFARAHSRLEVLAENRLLRGDGVPRSNEAADVPEGAADGILPVHLRDFSRAFRHFGDLDAMLENVVEGVAGCMRVSRAGVFCVPRNGDTFRLRAGLRCLEEVRDMEFSMSDPLARWLEVNARLISRTTLVHVEEPGERRNLNAVLNALGAEVIVPLQGRRRLMGWMFLGRRVTGAPFSSLELESLMAVAEHASNALENALLYEQAAVQRTLAETLLEAVNVGVVALSEDGKVRWFNRMAGTLLGIRAGEALDGPAARLGGRLGDLLLRRVAGEASEEPMEWRNPVTQRALSVATKRLTHEGRGLGAVAILEDLTEAHRLRDKQHRLERAAFWQELAAAIAHGVRNPLVAINTYFQLLPEKHDDPEFRDHFAKLVPEEIARLNRMVEQINEYANPKELRFEHLNVNALLTKAVASARDRMNLNGVSVKLCVDGTIPRVEGDEAALVDCFARLIVNAAEAVAAKKNPVVSVQAASGADSGEAKVRVEVRDNGPGIPLEISERIFSPFCTSKTNGIGIGLPIVKRTVVDHNGRINVDTGDTGTCVAVEIPASPQGEAVR